MNLRPPASLTLRLALLFALVSALVMAGVGAHLYSVMAGELLERDDMELAGKVELSRHLLAEAPGASAVGAASQRWRDAFTGHHELRLALFDRAGRVLLEVAPAGLTWSALAALQPQTEGAVARAAWTDARGRTFRLALAWGRAGDDAVLIVLALERTAAEAFLRDHGHHVLAAVLLGTLVAAALGAWVSRASLKPVREIAAAAHAITASGLDRRLDVGAAPAELRALAESFNAMLQRLQDSFARLSAFSSDIAHELRTPLNNLLGQTQVALAQPRANEELRDVLASNVEECERLARMIDDMLFLARADNAQAVLRIESLQVGDEVQAVVEYFEPLAEDKRLRMEVGGGARLACDRGMLRRALANLLSNAIRHAPEGGCVAAQTCAAVDGGVEIVVSNDGEPIPPHHQARLFDRFYRADAARGGAGHGAGLGLAIVRSIMELHGGRVELDSRRGVPTRFVLRFPPAGGRPASD